MDKLIKTMASAKNKPVHLVISDKNWLETAAVDQLMQTADLAGIYSAYGLPDLHPGKGQPIGAAFVSEDIIYPHLVGSDIGCGMGVWQLEVKSKKINIDKWDKKLQGLDSPETPERLQTYIGALSTPLGLEHFNTKLGTIGGGNHFAEIQQVSHVYSEAGLAQSGLSKEALVLLVHSGSRGLGQAILQQQIQQFGTQGLALGSAAAQSYLQQHDYANAWAQLNRRVIADRFARCLGLQASPLLDVSHNHVQPLAKNLAAHIDGNKLSAWIHRKGASPSDQGLVMIPGSRGALSYLVKPHAQPEVLARAGFSLAHGAGRKWKRSDAKGRLKKRYQQSEILAAGISGRVICANKNLAYEEAPQAYKNIDLVVKDLVDAGLVELIAAFKPLLTYKTRSQS